MKQFWKRWKLAAASRSQPLHTTAYAYKHWKLYQYKVRGILCMTEYRTCYQGMNACSVPDIYCVDSFDSTQLSATDINDCYPCTILQKRLMAPRS